jgi:dUTP pyrophosphatase
VEEKQKSRKSRKDQNQENQKNNLKNIPCILSMLCPIYMILKLYVSDEKLKLMYKEIVEQHNKKISTDPFPDAGFDLLTPITNVIGPKTTHKLNLSVKCSATMINMSTQYISGFYTYPRSSMGSKTPLRLANSVGIIDSGYRGNLMAVVDNISDTDYTVTEYTKLIQICAPGLVPILVELVDSEKELSGITSRGEGGFGSTTEK